MKGFKIKPETDMKGFGMRKTLNWQQVLEKGNKWFVVTYQFEAGKFPCSNCKTSDYVWLSPQRTGIYRICLGCQTTSGPVSLDNGVPLEDREVTPEEAYQVFVKRKLHKIVGMVPKSLMDAIQLRRSRVSKPIKKKDVETF